MDSRKPEVENLSAEEQRPRPVYTMIPARCAQAGALIGIGYAAGVSARGTLLKYLVTSAIAGPSLATIGFFSGREFLRHDGPRKFAEFKQAAEKQAATASEFAYGTINRFRK